MTLSVSTVNKEDDSAFVMSESVLRQEDLNQKQKHSASTASFQTCGTNQTMSAITEAEAAARGKSPLSSVLTSSENLFGNEEDEVDSSKAVVNDIENAAAELGSMISFEQPQPSPGVLQLLTSINEAVNSLKGVVERNSNKLDEIEKLVSQKIEVDEQWRPQISNEVVELRKVLECEHLR